MARYDRKDRFYKRAKQERFVARSVYKLEEIDQRFGLLHRGDRVLDLGCAPGSWLQYITEAIGPSGLLVGYDLALPKVRPGPQVHCFVMDAHALTPEIVRGHAIAALAGEAVGWDPHPEASGEHAAAPPASPNAPPERLFRFNAVLSDLAPKTTGIRDADQARMIGLVEGALDLALALLDTRGCFVAKVFQGRGFDPLLAAVRASFEEVKVLKPEATREGSREAFIIARTKKPPKPPDASR